MKDIDAQYEKEMTSYGKEEDSLGVFSEKKCYVRSHQWELRLHLHKHVYNSG